MKLIAKFLLLGAIVWFSADMFSGISVANYKQAIIAAVVLALLNTFVQPILKLISLPVTILTLGLFSFVISAGMVLLMDHFVDGFSVASFWWALILSFIISIGNSVVSKLL